MTAISNITPQGGASNYVSQFLQTTNELIVLTNQLLGGNLSLSSFNVTGNLSVTQSLYANFVKLNGNDLTNELSNLFLTNNTQSVYVNVVGALANASGAIANAAFAQANLGFSVANSVYGFTNSISTIPAGVYATVNGAYAVINTAGAPANTAVGYQGTMENRIVNGRFEIDQRLEGGAYNATGANVGNFVAFWTIDRWVATLFPGTNNTIGLSNNQYTIQRMKGNSAPNTYNFVQITSQNSFSFRNTYAVSTYEHWIEGMNLTDLQWGEFSGPSGNYPQTNAQSLMLTFWNYASNSGNYSICLTNNIQSRFYITTYNVTHAQANTWVYHTVQIPGDQAGSWTWGVGYPGLYLKFVLGGSADNTVTVFANQVSVWSNNYLTGGFCPFRAPNTVNLLASNGAILSFADVRLRVGSFDVPHIARPFDTELRLCKRHFQKSVQLGVPVGFIPGPPSPGPVSIPMLISCGYSNGPPVGGAGLPIDIPFEVELCAPVNNPPISVNPGSPGNLPIITVYQWLTTIPNSFYPNTVYSIDTGQILPAEAGESFTKHFNTLWNTGNTVWNQGDSFVFYYTVEGALG